MSKNKRQDEEFARMLKLAGRKPQDIERPRQDTGNSKQSGGTFRNTTSMSSAPYNFVSVNTKVFRQENMGDISGYLQIEFSTESPLFIRDTLNAIERKRVAERESRNGRWIQPSFFSPGGVTRVPGSSFRGVLRNLVEVVSFSEMKITDLKRQFFFRSFADKSLDFRRYYSDGLLTGDINQSQNPAQINVKAGYLFHVGDDWFIRPSKNGGKFLRVNKSLVPKWGPRDEDIELCDYTEKPDKSVNEHTGRGNRQRFMKFSEVDKLAGVEKGYLIKSKDVGSRYAYWLVPSPDLNPDLNYSVSNELMRNYELDSGRKVNIDLLKSKKSIGFDFKNETRTEQVTGRPCFFITDEKNNVLSFGHTGLFRKAYKNSIGAILSKVYGNDLPTIPDIAESLFGSAGTTKDLFPGKLWVEDFYCEDGKRNDKFGVLNILSSPKPTTFQHYLEQIPEEIREASGQGETGFRGIKHYDSAGAKLRGWKFYWHGEGEKIIEKDCKTISENFFRELLKEHGECVEQTTTERGRSEYHFYPEKCLAKHENSYLKLIDDWGKGNNETQHTVAFPIAPQSKFNGRIRFNNLTRTELGALLKTVKLMQNRGFKLGMGKPIGMGSCKFSRATVLLDENSTHLYSSLVGGLKTLSDEETDSFISEFMKTLSSEIGQDEVSKRHTELSTILDVNLKPRQPYMDLSEFKERKILPVISEVALLNKK